MTIGTIAQLDEILRFVISRDEPEDWENVSLSISRAGYGGGFAHQRELCRIRRPLLRKMCRGGRLVELPMLIYSVVPCDCLGRLLVWETDVVLSDDELEGRSGRWSFVSPGACPSLPALHDAGAGAGAATMLSPHLLNHRDHNGEKWRRARPASLIFTVRLSVLFSRVFLSLSLNMDR